MSAAARRRRVPRLLCAAAAVLAAASCGQRGPLYLPEPEVPPVPAGAPRDPGTAEAPADAGPADNPAEDVERAGSSARDDGGDEPAGARDRENDDR